MTLACKQSILTNDTLTTFVFSTILQNDVRITILFYRNLIEDSQEKIPELLEGQPRKVKPS